jgi:hypothetical protein
MRGGVGEKEREWGIIARERKGIRERGTEIDGGGSKR